MGDTQKNIFCLNASWRGKKSFFFLFLSIDPQKWVLKSALKAEKEKAGLDFNEKSVPYKIHLAMAK